jgi:hypothetical protein
MDAIVLWNKNSGTYKKSAFPKVNYTSDGAGRPATIEFNAASELNAGISNIILGKSPIGDYDNGNPTGVIIK